MRRISYVIRTIYHVVRMTHYLMRTRLYVMWTLRVMGYAQDNASCTKVISHAYEILYSANNIKCYIHKVLWHSFMRTKSGRAYKIYNLRNRYSLVRSWLYVVHIRWYMITSHSAKETRNQTVLNNKKSVVLNTNK